MEWKHEINWFEIPTNDLNRAAKFYSTILNKDLKVETFCEMPMAVFSHDKQNVNGCLIQSKQFSPSDKGVKIYLNGGEDLSHILNQVEKAGGKIVMPKTFLKEEIGYIAMFIDTEGNAIGLHSMN